METKNPPALNAQEIINILKQCSDQGLNFQAAKEKLRSQGFSDTDINMATDDYQYGQKQVSDVPTQVTQYFEAHPEQAMRDGANLLQAERKEERTKDQIKAVLDIGASEAAREFGPMGIDAEVEYKSKFAFDVGVSYWLLMAIGILVDIGAFFLVYWLNVSNWYYIINGAISVAIVIFLIWRT